MRRTGEGHYVAEFGDRIEGEDDEVAVEAAGNLVKLSELGNLPSPLRPCLLEVIGRFIS